MEEFLAYTFRSIVMFLITWTAVRVIGKKSISEMTSYDLAALMLFTTVAAEPLVFKITSKAVVGVVTIVAVTMIIGYLSIKAFFYNFDNNPTIVVFKGKVLEKELKKSRMNIPLLMSELRILGYQNVSDVEYAILEPNGRMSAIPKSQSRPLQTSDMALATPPEELSVPLIIDGKLINENLQYIKHDLGWLLNQLKAFQVANISEVLLCQMDSKGQLYVDKKKKQIQVPNLM